MFYYLRHVWGYLQTLWNRTPALIERLPDTDSEGSRRSVLIYEDSSEEETDVYSRA